VYTGGGKTVVALACAEAAARVAGPGFRLVVVVPTIALADQWVAVLGALTNTEPHEIYRLQGSRTTTRPMSAYRVVVAVVNSAARAVATFGDGAQTMLVVDEAHRAGSPSFRAALAIPARFRLGLSATPERDDLDAAGEPIAFADQAVAQALGDVVFRFGLAEAKAAGLLPSFTIEHHGLTLEPEERAEYERQSRQIDGLADRLRSRGITRARARTMQGSGGESGAVARAYVGAVSMRKDLLYRASQRAPIALRLIRAALRVPENKILVFNERIAEAEKLFRETAATIGDAVALEHSQLSIAERRRVLEAFRTGDVRVLISAKSLIEGIDVPDATVGISVASTGSVRQRIQSIGRVLRNAEGKRAVMHLLYVRDTTDDAIYGKENWDDLTGEATNRYFVWAKDAAEPTELPGPPHVPKPTEPQEHERLGAAQADAAAETFAEWNGMIEGVEYSVDTKGTIRNITGANIANPQGVPERLEALRGAKGGRITVTPRFRYVLASKRVDDATRWYAIARLDAPFAANAVAEPVTGDVALDRVNGAFRIRPIQGGVIERNVGGAKQRALTAGDADDPLRRNARTLLQAWRARDMTGCKFFVSGAWQAWYLANGTPTVLCSVPGGFAWPAADTPTPEA
jgi:superfamily II DNA or RNA helicase